MGEVLAPYTESDTFLSRDGGFTWEEVHKDAHLWEFGDSGSIILIVNDEEPTDHVLFTTDEGLSWREYKFSNEKLRINTIISVPEDTSRKFMLLGHAPGSSLATIVHIDFSSLTHRQCRFALLGGYFLQRTRFFLLGILNEDDPAHDDFELWSPSEGRTETCLFGRQVHIYLLCPYNHKHPPPADTLSATQARCQLRCRQGGKGGAQVCPQLCLWHGRL